MVNKSEFIKSFLPDTVKDVSFVQIDLDISNLSIPDILRNINKSFPRNSRDRNKIITGELVVSVLCKSKTLIGCSGIILIVCANNVQLNIASKKYIIVGVGEENIVDDDSVLLTVDKLTSFLVTLYKDTDMSEKFNDFYVRYLYDDTELKKYEYYIDGF